MTRMEAQVDQMSRMVHVVVEVEDRRTTTSENRPALLPGTFVDVRIFGSTLDRCRSGSQIRRPRRRPGLGLRRRQARDPPSPGPSLRPPADAPVARGSDDGDLVIVSSLDAVTDGMAVRNSPRR